MRYALLLALLCPLQPVQAQPLNGNYTVGGVSPDYATLQDAATAVKSAGVTGPVFFNIRPGTYTKDGGASTLFVLDGSIAGVSPISRITLQPDASSGGNINNVILQADFNSSSPTLQLVKVTADYVTLRDLTFKDNDSLDTPVSNFISAPQDPGNPSIEGLEIHNCTFLGTPYATSGAQFGSDIGILSAQHLTSATITNNRFYRILRGITNENGSVRGGTITVEDNEFYQGYGGTTGSGNPLGIAIELACTHASIRRNKIDFAGGAGGGRGGIRVIHATSAIIERNLIMHRFAINTVGFTGIETYSPFNPVDSILIVNNAIVANQAVQDGRGMDIKTPNTKVLFNTIVDAGGNGVDNIALRLTGQACTVLNNIILEMSASSFLAIDFGVGGQAQNLVSDYNIIFLPPGHGSSGFIRHNGSMFSSLSGYQAGTGLDSSSDSTTVLFSDLFHLDECQAQDARLNGVPVPGISDDYDGGGRDPVLPFRGADEAVRIPFDMFADGFRAGTGGAPFSVAAGDFFDDDSDHDIAVPDYDNRQILLFRNQRPARTFVQSTILFPQVQPGVIKLFDFDEDGFLDLIVAGDTTAVDVFWGLPGGGFDSPPVTVGTSGRVRSIEPEPSRKRPDGRTVWITEDNGFLPTTGFLGSIVCFAGRQLCHDLTYRKPPPSYHHDTIPYTVTALAAADLDTSSGFQAGYELIALTLSSNLVEVRDLAAGVLGGPACEPGYYYETTEYQFGTGSYLGFGSNLIIEDFDGDADLDIIATSAVENSCVLIRNLGNVMLAVGDTIPMPPTRAIVALDYENDGDFDFVAAHRTLYENGITVFLNDGLGNFTAKPNCFFPFANGFPNGMVASDFDLDGKTDIAIASSFDSLFVLYNLGGFNEPPLTDVEERFEPALPRKMSLAPNYPNPFNPSTHIRFELSSPGLVTLKVYNVLGQEVATLVKEYLQAGRHEVAWQPRGLASGVYFYRLQAGGVFESRRLLLLK